MNFENYNKIYKEILDDESDELSSNYLLNKYEIKHEEELLNILNQIKKNEYISSDNVIINRLIKELDIDENLLDVNEIINIKDKVIDYENMNIDEDDIEAEKIETEKIIENKIEDGHKIIEAEKSKNKKLAYILIPAILLLGTFLFLNNSSDDKNIEKQNVTVSEKIEEVKDLEETEKPIEKIEIVEKKQDEIKKEVIKEVVKTEEKIETPVIKKEEIKKVIEKPIEKVKITEKKKEEIKEVIEKKVIKVEEKNSLSEDSLDKLEGIKKIAIEKKKEIVAKTTDSVEATINTFKSKNEIKLNSLEEISKYQSKLKYKNNQLYFNGNYYKEKSTLFGFKIFKITPYYVKFEDPKKNIRKRFTIK